MLRGEQQNACCAMTSVAMPHAMRETDGHHHAG
jgi:hypothetical protein